MKNINSKGFTLIELMIVVVVVGVLAAIAIPAYQSYVERARRADAKSALLALQLAQEKWRANNPTYSSQLITELGYDDNFSPDNYYSLTINSADDTSYQIIASPIGKQASDSCGTFAVNQDGPDFSGTYANQADCWQR